MGRKDGIIFFQKQKPLIVSNVDAPQQSIEMLRRKAEQALFFLIRVVGHLAAGSILAFSVFFCASSCLIFSYDKCSFDSLHWISLKQFLQILSIISPSLFFFSLLSINLINFLLSLVLGYVPQACVDGHSLAF